MTLFTGLYDLVITNAVRQALSDADNVHPHIAPLGHEEAADRLVDALVEQIRRTLENVTADTDAEATLAQLRMINDLLGYVRRSQNDASTIDDLSEPAEVLRAIHLQGESAPESPVTGLAVPWLFTAGKGTPSLIEELRREAAACDGIDILVSFITVSGVRKLMDIFKSVTAAGAGGRGRTRIRVLTTTYMGATEALALDELSKLNGCEVKISLDPRRSRLHAKAWIFQRHSGFGSAYVGSANFSYTALIAGTEWTVKFTQRGQEELYTRARAHFDTLWADDEFVTYRHDDAEVRDVAIRLLKQQRSSADGVPLTLFDIQPKPYQRDMLDQLAIARENGRNRNLVVAATGTGKTVVAALDYREQVQQMGGQKPRLLFVAHRAQILRQAHQTYKHVLRDHAFGKVMTGGVDVAQHDHLFVSIDTLTSRKLVERFGSDYWHTVVIDECHRLAADRFHRLASAIQPAQLIGLTATPERTDGQSIMQYFTPRPDGAPAVELRLWDALDMQLLVPFEYFAIDDQTDFSAVEWDRAGETAQLDELLTGNDIRAKLVIDEWHRLSGDARQTRAIAFCVSVAHAEFMTRKFNEAGIPAMCVTGQTPRPEQLRAPHRLAKGDVAVLVTVDLFNEGVDIPLVDTLLLLRPTQSALLFQQQIGRGLRLAPRKNSCLILDFVGQHRAEFRFDHLLSGITGLSRNELVDAVERGFSSLPPGCHIQLQRQTQQQVLKSLRAITHHRWSRLINELHGFVALTSNRSPRLSEFLHGQRLNPEDIYRDTRPSGWSTLRRAAGLIKDTGDVNDEAAMSRRFGDLLHVDDLDQIDLLRALAASGGQVAPKSDDDRLRLQMLTYQVSPGTQGMAYTEFLDKLQRLPACCDELGQLADVLEPRSRITRASPRIPGIEETPLRLHAAYRIREILTAVRFQTAERRTPFQAGVLPLKDRKTELLFVTLDKSEALHPGVAYHDYAISPTRFHWQTQNAAGPNTMSGRRYIESLTNGWQFQLFVRLNKEMPYRACGPVRIQSRDDVTGDRPMSIEWTLDVPMPARLFAEFSVLRGQT
jgi:superfamily II DNA or RNA helicase/HKD family nuclease